MPFHVYVFELDEVQRGRGRSGRGHVFTNLDEQQLRTRIVETWDYGRPMTWGGRTIESRRIGTIRVFETNAPVEDDVSVPDLEDNEVTNDWILGHAGRLEAPPASESTPTTTALRDRRRVMVVHGRNLRGRDAMFTFLRALGLRPIEWEEAVAETGIASPHNLDAVRAAMDVGQAVVVVLTAEDRAGLLPQLAEGDDDDVTLRGQPRQNVILEAGLAMGIDRTRVVLVELGSIRRASDFDGLNVVRLTNAVPTRIALRSRLQSAGCEIDEALTDWARSEAGGDFDAAVVTWSETRVDGDAVEGK